MGAGVDRTDLGHRDSSHRGARSRWSGTDADGSRGAVWSVAA